MKRPLRTPPVVYALTAVLAGGLLSGCGAATTESAGYTVDAAVTSLKVTSSGGSIEVVVGGGDSVKVTENLKYDGDKPRTSHTQEGGQLVLTAPKDCGGGFLGGSTCEISYRVEVPKALSATLESDGGDITVDQAVAGRLTARSDGGKVTAGFAQAPDSVDIGSAGGNVVVRVPGGPYAVDSATDGGSQGVRVATAPDAARTIRVRTDGGSAQVLPQS
ncbi:hypothetical protein AB0C52_19640 [Streptomyces sp. NPDC048717]|uniref:hypothetical protein n=1 Tax=unclassified Streptomyces TaxID=2593676 RepID=UPI00342D6740